MTSRNRSAWDAALDTIRTLRVRGYVALLAGGCVRDMLLKRTPKDFDVATDASPQQLQGIFPRTRSVGAKFGVILVRRFGHDIEVATFRKDGHYLDGRHPETVHFGSPIEDARRRDFTINGMFFDPLTDRVIDHVGGREDLEAGRLCTIGDPSERFGEDHLRMLRAVRFAALLGFTIDSETRVAIGRLAHRLGGISPERIWLELGRILSAPSRGVGWSLLLETGLRNHLAGSWTADAEDDEKARRRLEALPGVLLDESLVLATVLCGRSAPESEHICRDLRLGNEHTDGVVWLVRSLRRIRATEDLELADLKTLMAHRHWQDLLTLLRADLQVRGVGLDIHDIVRRRAQAVPNDAVAPPPLITGEDLAAMGLAPGPRFGEILREIYRAQLNERITNRKEALDRARSRIMTPDSQ